MNRPRRAPKTKSRERPGPRRSWCLFPVVLCLCGSCASPFPPQGWHYPAKRVEVPLRMVDTRPYVSVHLNGAGPYSLLIDTGAQGLFLPRRVVEELNLRVHANPGLLSGAKRSRLTWLRWVQLNQVQIGEASFTNVIAVVLDEDRAETGVISLSLFQEGLVTFDFPKKSLRLSRGRLGPVDNRSIFAYRTVSDCPKVSCLLQDQPVGMLLDTGFTDWISLSESKADKFDFAVPPQPIGQGISLHYSGPVSIGRLAGQLQIGEHRVEKPLAAVGFGDRIGGKLLEHFAVTFDTAQNRVQFLRDNPNAVRAPAIRALGFWLERRDQCALVTAVEEGTPAAAAGIREGDRLLAVNGRPIQEINSRVGEELMEKNAWLHLTLQKASGDTVEMDLRLVDLVP